MIHDVCSRISEGRTRVISESHDSDVRHIEGKEVLQPESICCVICPGIPGVSFQAVNRNNTDIGDLVCMHALS